MIAITAGIGNGWNFPADVLEASHPLWDKAECYTDHTQGNHSVRDLGGILSNPQWDDASQGIRALLIPAGPAAQVVRDLADAALTAPRPSHRTYRRYSHTRRQADRAPDLEGQAASTS